MNILYSLQHLGYVISLRKLTPTGWVKPDRARHIWIRARSGGPENDFTHRNTTFMTWNLMHLAQMRHQAGGIPAHGHQRAAGDASGQFDFPNPEYR